MKLPSHCIRRAAVISPELSEGALTTCGCQRTPGGLCSGCSRPAPGVVGSQSDVGGELEHRIRGCRSALEAGAVPVVVAGWIKEVEADRPHAERELASTTSVVQLF